MEQREKENTVQVFPNIYRTPYYELEAWVKYELVEDEEDKKCVLEDFADEGFINADHIRRNMGVFLTKEQALTQMEKMLNYADENFSYFFIREKPLCTMLERMKGCGYIKEWLYYRGQLIDESLVRDYDYDGHNLETFHGRPEDMIRFKVGDIAVELGGDGSSYWGIVASVPPIYDGKNHGDYSDDQYTFYTSEDCHRHVLAHRLVHPIHIPDYVQELFVDEPPLIAMGNLSKTNTGLPMVVWIQVRTIKDVMPCVRFANNTNDSLLPNELVKMSISDNPRILSEEIELKVSSSDLDELRQWIVRNKNILLQHWCGVISTCEFYEKMK